VDTRDRAPAFVQRLARELRALSPLAPAPLRTIFVGGGTPTLLPVSGWSVLLDAIRACFDLSLIDSGEGEFTVECNPETADAALLDALRAGGVSRISIGAQSFEPRHLRTLERRHEPGSVERALDLAKRAGIGRRSIDLIYAIPGQSAADWERDLARALDLPVEHVSCYNLTYEPGTPLAARLRRGEFEPCPEDLEVEMFERAAEMLGAAVMERYEISNYARPGAECRHNLAYWRQEPWLAAGPSASAHLAGHRWKNAARLDEYLAFDDDGWPPVQDHEPPDPPRALRERVMTGLRLREGLDSAALRADAARIDPRLALRLDLAAGPWLGAGHIRDQVGRWTLDRRGVLLADRIAAELMAALTPGDSAR
jgi:oxygen-independent coproporphyrinogen-3 oxidase